MPVLHLLERLDAERIQALLQNFRGQITEEKTAFASHTFAFKDRAFLVKGRKLAGEFVEIIAEEIGAKFVGDRFQCLAEVQEMLGKADFLGGG